MSTPYLGEIKMFGGNYAPPGWRFCNGDLLGISQNEALFALLGTTYGGDGVTTFALPDLRGRIPLNQGRSTTGSAYTLGQLAGTESVTLTYGQLPAHTHPVWASNAQATSLSPKGTVCGAGQTEQYSAASPDGNMNPLAVGPAGGGNAHDNMMPYLAVSFMIAVEGVFPSQN